MVSRFFLSEDGFKVQFNWPAVCDARSTVETTYDGRTDSTCAVDHGRWCAQTRLYYSTVIRGKKVTRMFVSLALLALQKKSYMYGVLNKIYLQKKFTDECNFSQQV